jgi:3-hydroxyphenylacetate 6-hydroxylase
MCVASLLAHNALYTVFLHLIARFQIFPADGKGPDEIDPLAGLAGRAFVATPRGFRARFVPRDGQKLETWIDNPNGTS